MAIAWDWTHRNQISYSLQNAVGPHATRAGVVTARAQDRRFGVCTGKSFLWCKRSLAADRPPVSRANFDSGVGEGISPVSVATQAAHAAITRRHNVAGSWQLPFHTDMGTAHGLGVRPIGSGAGVALGHDSWLNHAVPASGVLTASKLGAYVLTISGPTYYHSLALYVGYAVSALFDSERGQYSSANRGSFRAEVLGYFATDYPGLASWELYKVSARA